jgi:hypothetical protein
MGMDVTPKMLKSNFMVKGLCSVLIILHKLAFKGRKKMRDCRKTMTWQEIMDSAQSLFLHPCCLNLEFQMAYQGFTLINGIFISDDEIRRMHGKQENDEDPLSFEACRSRSLANLFGVKHQTNKLIPLWEQHLMHEEACRDGEGLLHLMSPRFLCVCSLKIQPTTLMASRTTLIVSQHFLAISGTTPTRTSQLSRWQWRRKSTWERIKSSR